MGVIEARMDPIEAREAPISGRMATIEAPMETFGSRACAYRLAMGPYEVCVSPFRLGAAASARRNVSDLRVHGLLARRMRHVGPGTESEGRRAVVIAWDGLAQRNEQADERDGTVAKSSISGPFSPYIRH